MSTVKERHDDTDTVNLAESLSFWEVRTDVAVVAKPTYRIGAIHGKSVSTMYIAVALLDTEAGVTVLHSALIWTVLRNGFKK